MKIKANDKLEVIEGSPKYLAVGQIVYAINDEDDDMVRVSTTLGGPGIWDDAEWFANRFKVVPKAVVAKVDFDKPVETLEGIPVTIVTITGRDKRYPVLAYVGNNESLTSFTSDGKYVEGGMHKLDLRNVPVEIVRYVNVYTNGDLCDLFGTREEADSNAGRARIGCNRIVLTPTFNN